MSTFERSSGADLRGIESAVVARRVSVMRWTMEGFIQRGIRMDGFGLPCHPGVR